MYQEKKNYFMSCQVLLNIAAVYSLLLNQLKGELEHSTSRFHARSNSSWS